jgi:hypothetical protein
MSALRSIISRNLLALPLAGCVAPVTASLAHPAGIFGPGDLLQDHASGSVHTFFIQGNRSTFDVFLGASDFGALFDFDVPMIENGPRLRP